MASEQIILVVICDVEGRERLIPYRVQSVKAGLLNLHEKLDRGDVIVKHYLLPNNYLLSHILTLTQLGRGDAGSDAMGELGELLNAVSPAIRELNK